MISMTSTDKKYAGEKIFCRKYALAYPQPQFKICGSPNALSFTTTSKKHGARDNLHGKNAASQKPTWSSPILNITHHVYHNPGTCVSLCQKTDT